MLYIFLVDTGTMMTFDMNLALETVVHLKTAIASQIKIPEDKQVLLISGGESLDPIARVCSYNSAGTDTSPIFLFNKSAIESPNLPKCMVDYGPDPDVKERVEGCIDMNPNYNTVVARAEMAQQLYEMAAKQLHICEKLVHDQHLQQQGWAAVVANLEDIANAFSTTAFQLEENFNNFMQNIDFYQELLNNFKKDLEILDRIPVLPGLLDSKQIEHNEEGDTNSDGVLKLSQWISQKDKQSSLEQVGQQCVLGLEKFDRNSLEKLKEEVSSTLERTNESSMKEIKGLEERLFGLERLMCQAKKYVDEQKDLAQAFYHNQTRATNLRDPSILPDLCASHQQQLQVMLKNHQNLRDIRRRCANSKEELSKNLYHRLRWVMVVEKELANIDSKVLIYRENLRRLKKHLEIIHQIHLSPKIYLTSIVEVVRRKVFSKQFLEWTCSLSKESSEMHKNELEIRRNFQDSLSNHFLQVMFPGMNDLPGAFATDAPESFDDKLPQLSNEDIEYLLKELPDFADLLKVPSIVPMPGPSSNQIEIDFLKRTIEQRDIEIEQLNKKIRDMESSITTSTLGQIERIAVLSCEVGDIVLIYYEEKFQSFVIFTLIPILHFLHTDCVKTLALKTDSSEIVQKWILAEVTDKEYCQAKKPQNRYKIPVDTKFYRVRAKVWDKVSPLLKRAAESGLLISPSSSPPQVITSQISNIRISQQDLPAHQLSQSCMPTFSNIFTSIPKK